MASADSIGNPNDLSQFIGGDDYREIAAWSAATHRSFTVEQALVSGKTGALVLRAVMHSDNASDQKVILKIVPADGDLQEAAKHESAVVVLSPDFAQDHLVELVEHVQLRHGASLMIQSLAGGSVSNYASLGAFSRTADFRHAARTLLAAVAAETWRNFDAVPMTVAKVARQQLRKKLDSDGTLRTWLEDEFGAEVLTAGALKFRDDDSASAWLNPLLLADLSAMGSVEMTVLGGPMHGDLHAENALCAVGRKPDFADFRLIDLSYFEAVSSLAVDPVTLVMSEVQKRVENETFSFRDRRLLLENFDLEQSEASLTPEIDDLLHIVRDAYQIGFEHARARGFADDWLVQWQVATAAGALVWASRPRLGLGERVWFLELAARATTRAAVLLGYEADPSRTAHVGDGYDARRQQAQLLVDEVMRENEHFDGSVTAIAIIPADTRLSVLAQTAIVSGGWDIVLGFDPRADADGAPSRASAEGAAVRILRPSQDLEFSRAETVWIAGDGLEGAGYDEDKTLLSWRQENLANLSKMIQVVARASTGPVVVTTFGHLDKKSLLFLDKVLDHASPLARLVSLRGDEASGIEDYEPIDLVGDIEIVAASIPPRLAHGRATGNRVFVPRGPGAPPVELDLEDQLWFRQRGGELVHSGVALESQAIDGVSADFYHGRRISWLELEAGVDIARRDAFDALRSKVDGLLEERGTRRLRFTHVAGAGGTTIARRLAWAMHDRHPTLIFSQLLTVDEVTSRFERLSFLTGARILIILDGVPDRLANTLFERLQADSASAVLVLFERHIGASSGADLRPMQHEEAGLFQRIFTHLAPARHIELQRLAAGHESTQIPFLYALTAFRDGFRGVEDYVRRSLEDADNSTKTVLASLAVLQRYAGETIPASVFAATLNLPKNATIRVGAAIQKRAAGLVLEDTPGSWRTVHTVIAEEILRQLFDAGDADGATMSMSGWAQDFIEMVSAAYPDPLPESAHQMLLKLFVLRENRDESAYGSRQRFSEFISDLPSSARFDVMRALAETFTTDPHFWAHYARLLAYEGGDFAEAYKKVDTALALSPESPTIWHIRGVIGRKKVGDLISPSRTGVEDSFELEAAVREAADVTVEDLLRAAEFNDDSRYPQIDLILLSISVIEWAKRVKSFPSHQALLTSPDGAFYAGLLDTAEDARDELERLKPGEAGEHIAEEASIKLRAVYDDYQGLIDGWKGKLGRPGVQNRLVRSRLARAYVQRAGSYRALDFTSVSEIATLMENNLREDSRDIRSIREWLRVARRTGGGLDRAAEYVSYWVEEEPSRDAQFYDYVISALLTLQGRTSSKPDFERKLDLSKNRSQAYSRRRVIYEWLGTGAELAALVHHSEVSDWDRRADRSPEPAQLRRVRGVVDSVKDAKSGYLLIEGGLRVFFTPGGRFGRGRDEGAKVTALIGFAYDGPEAWHVRPAQANTQDGYRVIT